MAVRTPFNRRRSNSKPGSKTQGDTRVSDNQSAVPRLPHEHDESADSQGSAPRAEMQQAARDINAGLVDTDRGPVADSTYRKLKGDAR
ncbi:hypothetical protein BH11PSE7_BH11PSE7_34270 [soil metagenome]